ncbi:MAG: hypothetical protein ACI4RD_08335 [Kiritimatiellia bacterium]
MKDDGRNEGGSVLMEYLVVTMAVALPLVVLWHTQIYDSTEGCYRGEIGLGLQAMFQRVLAHVALPIP